MVELILYQVLLLNKLESLTIEGDSPVNGYILGFFSFKSSVYWKLGVNMRGTNLQI